MLITDPLCASNKAVHGFFTTKEMGRRILYINSRQYMAQNLDKSFFYLAICCSGGEFPQSIFKKATITHEKANFYYQCNHFFSIEALP